MLYPSCIHIKKFIELKNKDVIKDNIQSFTLRFIIILRFIITLSGVKI